jgi:hypothetical protein
MLDILALRRRARSHRRVILDSGGAPSRARDIADPGAPAVLIVGEVTEAVKHTEAGQIVGSVDRAQLWAVEGIILAGEVLDRLPDELESATDLIQAVTDAGYRWVKTRASSSSP